MTAAIVEKAIKAIEECKEGDYQDLNNEIKKVNEALDKDKSIRSSESAQSLFDKSQKIQAQDVKLAFLHLADRLIPDQDKKSKLSLLIYDACAEIGGKLRKDGILLYNEEKYQEAIHYFARADKAYLKRTFFGRAENARLHGHALVKLGDFKGALSKYDIALECYHEHEDRRIARNDVYMAYGKILTQQKDYDQAIAIYKKALSDIDESKHEDILSCAQKDYQEQKLPIDEPTNKLRYIKMLEVDLLRQLGEAYFYSGDPVKALESLNEANKKYNAISNYNLIEPYGNEWRKYYHPAWKNHVPITGKPNPQVREKHAHLLFNSALKDDSAKLNMKFHHENEEWPVIITLQSNKLTSDLNESTFNGVQFEINCATQEMTFKFSKAACREGRVEKLFKDSPLLHNADMQNIFKRAKNTSEYYFWGRLFGECGGAVSRTKRLSQHFEKFKAADIPPENNDLVYR